MKLFIVRHGETDHNVARRIQGPLLDDPLNARGMRQTAALEARFVGERDNGSQIAAVYSSPLKRAWITAEAVARGAGVDKVTLLPEMIEFSWGIHLGKTEEGETLVAMKRAHERWQAGHIDEAVEGGESPRSAWLRAYAGLRPIFEKHPNDTIVVVAHGRITKIVLAQLLYNDNTSMAEIGQGNKSVSLQVHAPAPPSDRQRKAH